jgi:hypothetical protein
MFATVSIAREARPPVAMLADGVGRRRPLLLLVEVQHVVVDVVRGLVAEHAGQLLAVLHELHQRVGHVDVAAGDGEGVGLGLVDQDEAEGMVVLRVGHALDLLGDRIQDLVVRRAADDLALFLQRLVLLLADLGFGLLVARLGGGRAGEGDHSEAQGKGEQTFHGSSEADWVAVLAFVGVLPRNDPSRARVRTGACGNASGPARV